MKLQFLLKKRQDCHMKQERLMKGDEIMKECVVCKEKIFQDDNGKWYMVIETGDWDYYYDRFKYVEMEIKYCYNCGKKYV